MTHCPFVVFDEPFSYPQFPGLPLKILEYEFSDSGGMPERATSLTGTPQSIA